jgi:hypothetical protein
MLYRQSADFRATMQSLHVRSFDECGKQWVQRLYGLPLTGATCDSMTHVVHRMMAESKLSACFSPLVVEWQDLGPNAWRLRWDSGRLWVVDQRREAMYFHFHAFKDRRGYREPQCTEANTVFEMTPNGFERASSLREVDQTFAERTAENPEAKRAQDTASAISSSLSAGCYSRSETPAPRILSTFNRRHRKLFYAGFLASLRTSGNDATVIPVAVGLYPGERERLVRFPGVKPVFRRATDEHVARRRLREFAEITRALPSTTPIAYWDAGDVIFQAQLQQLWELIRTHRGELLAVREPSGYPDNPAVRQWTETITDPEARCDAQRKIYDRPFINSGFLAASASVLTEYFETTAKWYDSPKLAGSVDPGDQMALNLYCHSRPDVWREIPESWNYCLWGRDRNMYYRDENGKYVDVRGVPICIVHGNAQTFKTVPLRRRQVRALTF